MGRDFQNLGVIAEHRGRGLGNLLRQPRRRPDSQAPGSIKMTFEVTANTGAIRLYEKIGFPPRPSCHKARRSADVDMVRRRIRPGSLSHDVRIRTTRPTMPQRKIHNTPTGCHRKINPAGRCE